MKAFVSYSLNDSDLYILTLLSLELNKKGVTMNQSNDFYSKLSPVTENLIKKAQLFIGLITFNGNEKERVISEYSFAQKMNVPAILLVENNVTLNNSNGHDLIWFDRHNPQQSMNILNERITAQKRKKEQDSDSLAWLIGGAAVLALVAILAGKKD